jgi:putative oxidoreductase
MNETRAQNRREEFGGDLGRLLIRVMIGAVFVYHGSQKLFGWFGGHGISGAAEWMGGIGIPLPTLSAVLAGVAEFVGGLAVLAGLGLRLAAVPMTFTMLVAIATVHRHAFGAQNGGMEYPLTLAAVLVGLALLGPGRFRLDFNRSSAH